MEIKKLLIAYSNSINKDIIKVLSPYNNEFIGSVDWMPLGGTSDSRFRVGGIKYTVNDLLKDKLIIIKQLN